jgi:hypothetical protein
MFVITICFRRWVLLQLVLFGEREMEEEGGQHVNLSGGIGGELAEEGIADDAVAHPRRFGFG